LIRIKVSELQGFVISSLMREFCYKDLICSKEVLIGGFIYNRPSPKKDPRGNRQRNSSSTSFQDFQESVSDAWDIGDDEFCIISGRTLNSCNRHRNNKVKKSTFRDVAFFKL
jgi:hypothetical protein